MRVTSAPLACDQIDFLHTSGGRTTGASERIRPNDPGNLVTWAQVHRASGKGIIADTGYGVGGASMGHVVGWDDEATLRGTCGAHEPWRAVLRARPKWTAAPVALSADMGRGACTRCRE